TVPKYGTANWPAAQLTAYNIQYLKTQEPGLVVLDWPGDGRTYWYHTAIDGALELPEDSALYTITLKLVRSDGLCSASWVQNEARNGSLPLRLFIGSDSVPLTKLIDDSGFVGVVNLEPGAAQDGSYYGMRQYNATLMVNVTAWGGGQDEPLPPVGPLVFAGIIITRL
ncbi:MAG TPA: hypothetical protein VKS03_05875, partial [Thermoanaerobaculia bacterium]|nr:hypothetical protein [Thermoanaerobaculia bacterium]